MEKVQGKAENTFSLFALSQYSSYAILFFAFLLPPVLCAVLLTHSILSNIMMVRTPKALGDENQTAPIRPELRADRPTAVILASPLGTQVSDLLVSYEILASSEQINTVIASPQTSLVSATGGLAFFPQYRLSEIQNPDLIVIPALVAAESQPEILNYVKEQAHTNSDVWILAHGEGALLLAQAGLLENKVSTTHFLAFDRLSNLEPATEIRKTKRFTSDSRVITSAGRTAVVDSTFFAYEQLLGSKAASEHAQKMGISLTDIEKRIEIRPAPENLGFSDLLYVIMTSGFHWSSTDVGIYLFEGISEWGLASMLDSFPRTFIHRTVLMSEKRAPIRTLNGLTLVPEVPIEETPVLDLLLIPARSSEGSHLAFEVPKRVQDFIDYTEVPVRSLSHVPTGERFAASLDLIEDSSNPESKEWVARMLEDPSISTMTFQFWPGGMLWLKALFVGVLGVGFALLTGLAITRKVRKTALEMASIKVV